jgi:hypothetical protein
MLGIRESRQIGGSGMALRTGAGCPVSVSIIPSGQYTYFGFLTYSFEILYNSVAGTVPPELSLPMVPLFDVWGFQLGFNFADQLHVDVSHYGDTKIGELVADGTPATRHDVL